MYYKALFKFCLVSFDYGYNRTPSDTLTEVEDSVIETFKQLIMTLNESIFKPLFLKLVDWVWVEKADDNPLKAHRLRFFYRLVNSLLSNLKSIFSPYYVYIFDKTVSMLKDYGSRTRDMDEVLPNLMESLTKCFMFDYDGFVDEEKALAIGKPLVNLLSITTDEYQSTKYLRPCLGQLGQLVSSHDQVLKQLNHDVLMTSRDENPTVRLSCLGIIEEWYHRIGDIMLVNLPETVPFLAELMEDEDERVEKRTVQVIHVIEEYLGESLQDHLK